MENTGIVWMQLAIGSLSILTACAVTYIAFKNWKGDRYLCDNCAFNTEALCNKAERPHALDCLAYKNDS